MVGLIVIINLTVKTPLLYSFGIYLVGDYTDCILSWSLCCVRIKPVDYQSSSNVGFLRFGNMCVGCHGYILRYFEVF